MDPHTASTDAPAAPEGSGSPRSRTPGGPIANLDRMPPPHLPPPERVEVDGAPKPGIRRHIGWLFWVGVAIAPLAALLLVIGNGVGPLRAAAVLAVLSVVIIGLSVVLRDDAAMVKDDVEDQLRTEVDRLRADIDSLRRGVEVSVHRELERVHRELETTRRDSVLRAESTRVNHNRLTSALPAAEDDIADDRRRAGGNGRGRTERSVRAITARAESVPVPFEGQPGYDWFATAEGESSSDRQEPIRYQTATYGTSRSNGGNWPQRGAEPDAAGADDGSRSPRRRRGNRYGGSEAITKPVGTEYGSSRRYAHSTEPASDQAASTTYEGGVYEATSYEASSYREHEADDPSDRRRGGRRRAAHEPTPSYELIDYDEAPPVYTGQRMDDGVYRGSRAATGNDDRPLVEEEVADAGIIDYSEYWSGSASPSEARRDEAGTRPDDYRRGADPTSEWPSRQDDGDPGWDTGSHRYNRDDPQVITGAITGDIFDIPYTVGGQALTEPGFGSGNGFGSSAGFGSGNGFLTSERNWDDPAAPAYDPWPASADTPLADPAVEFELPSLEHLPPVGDAEAMPASDAPASGAGGRHASHASVDDYPESSRYRSW